MSQINGMKNIEGCVTHKALQSCTHNINFDSFHKLGQSKQHHHDDGTSLLNIAFRAGKIAPTSKEKRSDLITFLFEITCPLSCN
jgi:hypothetical protein